MLGCQNAGEWVKSIDSRHPAQKVGEAVSTLRKGKCMRKGHNLHRLIKVGSGVFTKKSLSTGLYREPENSERLSKHVLCNFQSRDINEEPESGKGTRIHSRTPTTVLQESTRLVECIDKLNELRTLLERLEGEIWELQEQTMALRRLCR